MEFDKILTDDVVKFCTITLLDNGVNEQNLTSNNIGGLDLINRDFTLTIKENTYRFKVDNEKQRRELDHYLQSNRPNKCKIESKIDANKIIISAIFFSDQLKIFGKGLKDPDISIYYKDKVIKALSREAIFESLTIKSNGKNYFLINTGKDRSANRYDDETMQAIDDKDFSIYGDNIIVFIKKIVINNDYALSIEKILKNSWNKPVNYLKLAQGTIEFTNKANPLSALVSGTMDNLIKDNSSYLKVWDEYGDLEGDILLEKARLFASFTKKQLKKAQVNKGQFTLYFNESLPAGLSKSDQIIIEESRPTYVENKDLKWHEYVEELDNNLLPKRKPQSIDIKKIDRKNNSIVLDFHSNHDDISKKYITLSILGDEIQIKRRNDARRALLEGSSANPFLGLIIEKDGVPPIPKKSNSARTKTLSSFVQNKIFKNEPTSKQLEAIDLALNTPDIALIQGPPGTGKTTVITAILERLNEEYDLSDSINGKILITGSQHDAVENVISRLTLNDIPTIKFGAKGSSSVINNELSSWLQNISTEIKKKNPEIEKVSSLNDLDRYANAYMITKKDEDALLFVNETILNKRSLFSLKIINEAKVIRDNIKPKENNNNKLLIVRRLRTNQRSFNDDGQENACVFCNEFKKELSSDELAILKQAILADLTHDNMNFLDALQQLQLKFLDKYLPITKYLKPKLRSDVVDLIKNVRKSILDRNASDEDPKTSILYDFVNELDNNVHDVREALKDYNVAFSATTQQSVGTEMHEAKKKKKDQRLVYDTVIIDEAARVSPRDLLVPMVQAKNRIILVGDHRQLPHIIDEKIAEDLEKGHTADEVDYINKSMFQYLFDRLKVLEQRDQIKRTVTLDAQYRMHPLLGNFASDNFYKEHGEAFDSPLADSLFNHNLDDIEGKQAIWINVKNGNEKRNSSQSRFRRSEAIKIAEQLNTWIKSDEGKDLTFGVISFYKAQVNTIFEELADYGLTHKTSSGNFEVVKEYQEKIRIGTVDSFQGMEFDIVFLSTVRTYDSSSKLHNYQRIFGFLTSKNRLCVSMTRQKKALILVGDLKLFSGNVAQKGVPEIYNFYELCSKEGKII